MTKLTAAPAFLIVLALIGKSAGDDDSPKLGKPNLTVAVHLTVLSEEKYVYQ